MSDYIKRLFNMLIAAILAHANRLAAPGGDPTRDGGLRRRL